MSHRTADRERGAVLTLFAIALPALIMMTALAVDIGHIRMERRDLQSVADAVALDMVRQLDSWEAGTWSDRVGESRDRNDFPVSGTETDQIRDLSAVPGCYDQAADYFTPVGTASCTVALMESVKVVATDKISFYFTGLSEIAADDGVTARQAVARLDDKKQGEFLVGSFLASLDPASSSALGQLLNGVVPGASLISYDGLATSNITLAQLGTYLPVTAGSPDELLNTSFTIQELALASAQALQNNGASAGQVAALNQLAQIAVPSQEVRLGDALGVSAGGNPGAETVINVPQLLAGSVLAIDGDHTLTIDLGTTLPGVGVVDIELEGIEAPQRGGIEDLATATTEQGNITITPHIDTSLSSLTQNVCSLPLLERLNLNTLLGGVLNLLTCTLGGVLNQVIDVRLQATPEFHVELAAVEAQQHLDCDAKTMTITSTPSVIKLLSTQTVQLTGRVGAVSLGNLLTLTNTADATSTGTTSGPPPTFTATGTGPKYTTFTPTDVQLGANPLGLENLLGTTNTGTTLTVANVNLSTLANTVKTLITNPLNDLLGNIDTHFVDPIARLLGLNLGGAKLTPLWMQCELNNAQLGR